MNEKSNPMPMMYKTIPAVAELNKVQGFDPLKFLRHKVSRKTNEEMLQLELPYQKLWFRLRDAVIDPEYPGAKLDFFLRRAEWVDRFTNGFIQLFRRCGAF